jgi:hypothetical protein
MHYVKDACHEGGWKLRIQSENGHVRVVDLRRHLDGPIFEPLKKPAYFKRFSVNQDIDTVVWPNGADFSPDFLYEIGESVTEYSAPTGRRRGAVNKAGVFPDNATNSSRVPRRHRPPTQI